MNPGSSTASTPHRPIQPPLRPERRRWRATQWRYSVHSLQGTSHAVNQDSFHCASGRFWGVADGVGGGAHGEIASQMLLEFMASLSAPGAAEVQDALRVADRQIDARIGALGKGPGAAVVACVWQQDQDQALAVHVGDCKIFHLQRRAGHWHCLWSSTEQTYASQGLQPPDNVSPESPSNMVGCGMSADAQTHTLEIRNRQRLVVCSDGFSSQLHVGDVARLLDAGAFPLRLDTAQAWCHAARNAGSHDDVTVLIVERHDQFTPRARWAIGLAMAGACIALAAVGLQLWSLV